MRDRLFRITDSTLALDIQPVTGDKLLETLANLKSNTDSYCNVGLAFDDAKFCGEFVYWWYDTWTCTAMLSEQHQVSRQIKRFIDSELAKL